jgi:predicted GH43/DUF377 family glycosyl hydrolase
MHLVFVTIFITICFAGIALALAIQYKFNRILWSLFGACLGVAVLFPFRSYRISPLNLALKESITSDSIIYTRNISIPGYPDAYNPSLIPYEGGYLLSFRVKHYNLKTNIKKLCISRTSFVGLVKLNRQFEICAEPYLLDLTSYAEHSSTTAQDARLFRVDDKILLFFNDYGSTRHRTCHSMYVAELNEKNGKLQSKQRATLLKYDDMIATEKNWIPFISADKVYLIYSSQPHLILEPNLETGVCKKIASTTTSNFWKWGEIRGGTPALQIEEGLFTFFHSSQDLPAPTLFGSQVGRNYVMGAYLFENSAPFAIKKMTPFPLGSVEDYLFANRRKVIFPSGMAIEGNLIYVVWGKNDKAICVSTFDKEKLLSSMIESNQY